MITTIIRTAILYFLLIISVRIMGKRQIGDMQPNELVITLLISEIAAIPLQDTSKPILDGVLAVFVLVILEIILSVLTLKNMYVRKMMSGKSVIVIKDGVIDRNAMKMVRMTVLDLVEQLRQQQIFDISSVNFAVLEVNGSLSVLLKKSEQPATAKDVNADKDSKSDALPLPVISDGKIVSESLELLGITEKNLKNQIRTDKNNILLMTLDKNGNKNIIKKRDDS